MSLHVYILSLEDRTRPKACRALVSLCGFVLAAVLLALAVSGPAWAQQFTFKHYGQDEGLKNLDVFRVVQDKSEFLWVATENGLFRYDGSAFQRFDARDGIDESLTTDEIVDASGRLWVTTSSHLYYFANGRFQVVPSAGPMQLNVGQRLTSLDAGRILTIDGATLRVAHRAGKDWQWTISPYFSQKMLAAYPPLGDVHSVLAEPDGTLWLGCGEGLCRVKGDSVTLYGPEQGVPSPAAWLALFRDSHGTLWVRSPHYIRVLTPGSAAFVSRVVTPHTETHFFGAGILTFAEDRFGNVLTQSTTGLARWNGKAWEVLDSSNGLNFGDISTILSDHEGSIWFATRGHGLERWLGYGEMENWTMQQGLRNDLVWSIFRDRRGRLWIGDQLQVSVLDPRQRSIHLAPGFPPVFFQQTSGFEQASDGSIWIASVPGFIAHSDPGSGRFTEFGKIRGIVRTITGPDGVIWFCTREGLYAIRTPSSHPKLEKVAGPFAVEGFDDAARDAEGNLWFASDHHLYRLAHSDAASGDRWSEVALDPAMTRGGIRSFAIARDGTFWMGGGLSGLYHFKVEDGRAKVLAVITPPEFASTDIQFVRFDRDGWLWVGTDLGVQVFDGTHWKLITQRDGLISNDTNEGAFFADTDGSVWIGVNGGLTHLLHPRDLGKDEDLDVRLTSVTLGDRVLDLIGGRNRWRWHNAPLDIRFTSPNYDREGSLQFRYRLSGLEQSWNKTTEYSLHYAAVPPGDYRFEVQALDPNRRNASEIASLAFTIRPPWWRTRSFYLLMALLATLLSMLVWRWRELRLMLEQKALQELIAQRTSELEAEKRELMTAREALQHQASHDALTGLWNRPAILEILDREMTRARRERTKLTVVLADLDHFKQINDTHGHLAGDSILRQAAGRMVENIRPYDFIGRYGGEEFIIVLPGLAEEPFSRLTQLHQAISERPFAYEDKSFRITSSFGAASLDRSMVTVEDMVRCADQALYRAKADGRNCIVFYTHPAQPSPLVKTP